MQSPLLVLLLLAAVFPSLATAEVGDALQFSTPAQLGPETSLRRVEWALVLLDGTGSLDWSFHSFSGELINHTELALGAFENLVAKNSGFMQSGPSSDPQTLQMEVLHGKTRPDAYASFYVEGSDLSIETSGAIGKLDLKSEGGCAAYSTPETISWSPRAARVRELCPASAGPRFMFGTGTNFSIEIGSAQYIEWHNATLTCEGLTQGTCPLGGGFDEHRAALPNGDWYANQFRYFEGTDFASPVQAQVQGYATYVLTGSRELDIAVDGWMRLPVAKGGICAACLQLENETLYAEGDLVLNGLQPGVGSTLQGQVGGDLAYVKLDETSIDPALLTGQATAVVAATVAGLVVLKLLLAPLFTRLSKEQALEHPRRRAIFEHIQRNPGTSFRETARIVGMAAGTVRHHLNVLQRSGMVVERPHGATVRFFENHGKHDADWVEVVMLREPALKLLFDWLKQSPQSPQTAILEAMEVHGWSRSTTQHRLSRLVDAGLVTIRLQGRYKMYSIADRPPPSTGGRPNPMAAPAPSPS